MYIYNDILSIIDKYIYFENNLEYMFVKNVSKQFRKLFKNKKHELHFNGSLKIFIDVEKGDLRSLVHIYTFMTKNNLKNYIKKF